MSKYKYGFEVEESINANKEPKPVDSLKSALEGLSSDGVIHAFTQYPDEDRPRILHIELYYEDVKQLSEEKIHTILDDEVDEIRLQNKNNKGK